MVWVKLTDTYPDEAKIACLSDAAFRMNVTAKCWSNRNGTDGFVPESWVTRARPRDATRVVQELTAPPVGLPDAQPLWHLSTAPCTGCQERWGYTPKPGGFWIHDLPEYQGKAATWDELREKKRAAGRLGGIRSGAARRGEAPSEQSQGRLLQIEEAAGEADASAPALAPGQQTRSRTRTRDKYVPASQADGSAIHSVDSEAELASGAGQVVAAYARGLTAGGHPACDPSGREILGSHARTYLRGPTDLRILGAPWYDPVKAYRGRVAEATRAAEEAGRMGKNPAFLREWLERQRIADEETLERRRVEQQRPRSDLRRIGGAA